MTRKSSNKSKSLDLEKFKKMKIDIGCGENKHKGFFGIDYRDNEGVDLVHNLEEVPYPLPDECASLCVASHVLEHINPHNFVFVNVMNEIWRLLEPDGEFAFVVPYAGSPGFWQDPTHVNGITNVTLWYFDPLHPSNYYKIYKPKPWKIKSSFHNPIGNLEAVLVKRREDPSYVK